MVLLRRYAALNWRLTLKPRVSRRASGAVDLMLKSVWFAVGAAVLGSGACAAPAPRYAIVSDPLAASPATEPVVVESSTPLQATSVAVEPEVEAPRAAPLGRVETVALAQLPPPSAGATQESAPRPSVSPTVQPSAPATATEPIGAALSHVVGLGDTFFAIARRYGVGPQAVAEANGMTFASTLRLGQRLILPAGARDRGPEAARAPVIQLAQAAAPAGAPGAAPAQTPPAAAPAAIQTPTASVSAPVASTVVAPAPPPVAPAPVRATPPSPAPSASVLPTASAPPAGAAVRPAAPAGTSSATPTMLPGRGLFVWPVRGDLISGFGPKGVGQRSDGVNIAAAEGDSVRAAASGTVVYAGDQVKGGFGKLVLLEHEGRWFTAYAHLSEIKVRMKDRVAQSQEVGRAGRTGSVGSPQLYFEVRHAPAAGDRARPVDPLPLLPQ